MDSKPDEKRKKENQTLTSHMGRRKREEIIKATSPSSKDEDGVIAVLAKKFNY